VRERIFTKAERMRVKRDRIPDKILKEIFPRKLNRH
jgi:ribosomal protein S30